MNTTEEMIYNLHMNNIDTKWESFAKEIMQLQTKDALSILYATDVHYIRKYARYVQSYYKVKEMVDFSNYAGFDLLALTGDLVDGNTVLDNQYRDLYDIVSLVRKAKTTSVVLSKGNHDDCSWYAYSHGLSQDAIISEEQWYTHVINPIRVQFPIVLDEDNVAGGYYYVDYPLQKIRVINLNTNDIENIFDENGKLIKEYCGQWCLGLREKQLKWLVKALNFNEEGWSVIFMSHDFLLSYGDFAGRVKNGEQAWEIIKAYMENGKGRAENQEEHFALDVSFDFTNNKSSDVLTYICGHSHEDNVFKHDNVTVVTSQKILAIDAHGENDVWDNENVNIVGGWDCILIDKNKRTLKRRRYGVSISNLDIKL